MSIVPEDPVSRRKRLLEEQPSTFHQHGLSSVADDVGGRFGARGTPTVVGTEPIPKYPELPESSPFHHDPVPDEPPLGSLDPFAPTPVAIDQGPGAPAGAASSSADVECDDAGAPLSEEYGDDAA